MRSYLLLYINGKEHRFSGKDAFVPLSTYLRYTKGITGTKEVCQEGDCGACTVLAGRLENGEIVYKPINSCIQFLYQLDCTHIVTVEGLQINGKLNPVQDAMVKCHGAQCGYCTSGMIATMSHMFDSGQKLSYQEIKDKLVGNLCRCTGYEPIINAALSVDTSQDFALSMLYPSKEMIANFASSAKDPVTIATAQQTFFEPTTLKSALEFKATSPGTVVVAGGTDVGVYWNKRNIVPSNLLSLSLVPELNELELKNNQLIVGAKRTLSDLEQFCQKYLPEFAQFLELFGSPQIRNAGTLAGNIANGSPIADTLPLLCILEAQVELAGISGSRQVNINKLYKGYKQLDIKQDEIIARIIIPLPSSAEILKLYKVSNRQYLDISTVSAAIRLRKENNVITKASIAYGGVAPVVMRLAKVENFLEGKPFALDTFVQAAQMVAQEINPISDVRSSREYRLATAGNLLLKFYWELTCQQ